METDKLVFVIGAARSGTKVLRDAVSSVTGIGAVPYDVSFLWRSAVRNPPVHDEFAPALAGRTRTETLTRRLVRLGGHQPVTIEKTVGNSLRVAYVAKAFPQAKFLFLGRDGVDVTESAQRQWTAPGDWRYAMRKATKTPLYAAPGYVARYGMGLIARRTRSGARTPPIWGPLYDGIHEDLLSRPLEEVCARQWARCVDSSLDDLGALEASRSLLIGYDEFVTGPADVLGRIWEFIGVAPDPAESSAAADLIRSDLRGTGRSKLAPDSIERIAPIVDPVNLRLREAGLLKHVNGSMP